MQTRKNNSDNFKSATETRRHREKHRVFFKKIECLKGAVTISRIIAKLPEKVISESLCLCGRRYYRVFIFSLALVLSGCTLAKVDVNVVSERTSLENQVLGSYNSLSEEMLLVASVRGVSPTGTIESPPRRTPEQADAIRAMETIAFHADDIETFKRLGWVGENQEGLLTPFTREAPQAGTADLKSFAANYSAAEFQQVLQEVNRSRDVLMLRVIQTNENFTIKDLPAIRKVFARINRQNSAPGARVQDADGKWQTL